MPKKVSIIIGAVLFALLGTGLGAQTLPLEGNYPQSRQMEMDADGDSWRTYDLGELKVGLNVRYMRDYGRYYRVDVYVMNAGGEPVLLDFENASLRSSDGYAKKFGYKRFIQRSRRHRFWSSMGIQTAMTASAIVLDEALNGEYYRGDADRYSFGRDVAHEVSSAVIYEGAAVGGAAISSAIGSSMSQVYANNVGYLANVSIAPGTAVKGHFFARYARRADFLIINLPIGGRVLSFEWKIGRLEKYSAR